jgi:hypothetical protein
VQLRPSQLPLAKYHVSLLVKLRPESGTRLDCSSRRQAQPGAQESNEVDGVVAAISKAAWMLTSIAPNHCYGVGTVIVYDAIVSRIILKVINILVGPRVTKEV